MLQSDINFPSPIYELAFVDSYITKNYPEVIGRDNLDEWTVEWELLEERSTSKPASALLIIPSFQFLNMDEVEITNKVIGSSEYLSRWNHADNWYRAAFAIPGRYKFSISFYYYK